MHLLLHLNKIKISRARLLVKQQPFYVYLNFFGIKTLIATNSHYFTEHIRLGYGHFETPSTENNDVTILALESGQDNFKSSFNFLLPEREVS
jgi:hypothetical protein